MSHSKTPTFTITCSRVVKINLEGIASLAVLSLRWFTEYLRSQWPLFWSSQCRQHLYSSLGFFFFWHLLSALNYPFIPDSMTLNQKPLHLCQPTIRPAPYLSHPIASLQFNPCGWHTAVLSHSLCSKHALQINIGALLGKVCLRGGMFCIYHHSLAVCFFL